MAELLVQWYLWARNDDPDTNKYLAKVIGEQYGENSRERKCADGKKRKLWICRGYDQEVKSAISAIKEFNLKLEVFQDNGDGKIVRYDLWKPEVKKTALHANLARGVHKGGKK